ncbi:protein slit-like [Centruroides sculpturatus]|uniref:protein slit-like n=1 Tax=Centruroides sculpturatus TaxID=218467 RepID=UPI000C6DC6FF|nr:protein slit-like [Centruroides sculpturatus]
MHGELKVLPGDLFYNLHNLTKLDLSDNKLESIHPLVFNNLTKLEYLDLGFNDIKDLPVDMLKGLSNLRAFSISGNKKLAVIPFGFFKKLHNLNIFYACCCSFSSLEEDIFSDLINLIDVDLGVNQIEHLPRNLLRNNKRLTEFSCWGNEISTLPTGIFHGLSELRWLSLRENRLENLPEDVFQSLSSLETLILSENRLTFLPENIFLPLTNLTRLDLSDNSLSKIISEHPFGSSKHLTYVHLINAGLTQWPVINWTEYNLTRVDFSNNHFETVKLPIYTPNRMKINLSNCKIRTIYIDDRKYGFQMPSYDLSNNEITCNYELQQFISVFKSNMEVARKMFPNIEKTKCFGEERNLLDNTSFVIIENYCPMNCECSVQDNLVMVNCSGKGIDRIPEVLVSNATVVDFSNNYINDFSEVDCVTWRNVSHLHLSNNSISNISDYVLSTNLKYLWLDGNRLTELPSGLMHLIDVSPEFKIYLSRNNLSCNSHSLFTKDWLLKNRKKIVDFSDVFCTRNSSCVSFTEIVCNHRCKQILEDNLASSVNVSCTKCVCSDEVSSVSGWKLAVAVLTLPMLLGIVLYIKRGLLRVLPEDLFYNLYGLTKLDLSYNNIESIHPLVFRYLTPLEYLDLNWNRIKDLSSDMLKGLSNLTTFSITNNRELSEIPSGFFKKLFNLTKINAESCSISSLEEDVFFDLINLKLVYLAYNQIEHLPLNLLRNNKRLTRFSCWRNKLSSIPTGIFHGLSELQWLNLRRNRLEILPVDVFQNLSSLQILDLSFNRLTFLHENLFLPLSKLTHLDLFHNNFTKISGKHPFGSSKHLTFVRLINAGLKQWPMINWTEYNLTRVDFSNNRFETVKLLIYTPNRVTIRLSNCKIRTIYMDERKYGFQMPTYDLSNNEITCDYELQQFIFALMSNIKVAKRMFPNIEKTKCYGEERNLLDNTSLVVIGKYCPLNCECSAHDNHVMVNCSGKGIDRVPEVLVPNATIVDLSNNYINDLSDVDCVTWRNVTHLHLSNNSISNISDYVILLNLKFLWLDGNRLTELPSGVMNLIDVSSEFKIYLSRNNLSCNSHSLFTKEWLLKNRKKIVDFSDVFCTRNSSSVSFAEIVFNDRCKQIPEDNLTSSVNVSCTKCVSSDEVSSVLGWKLAVSVLTSLLLLGVIIVVSIVYYRRRRNDEKEPKTDRDEVIFYNVYT